MTETADAAGLNMRAVSANQRIQHYSHILNLLNRKAERKVKPNIKKLIKIAAEAFSGPMLVSSAAVFADDGAEFELYYDFEDYSASLGSGILPDNEYWGIASSTSGNLKQFGSYIEDGNTSMRLLPWAEPVLFFNRIAESGRLHISFDFKTANPIFDTLVLFDDGVTSQDPRY